MSLQWKDIQNNFVEEEDDVMSDDEEDDNFDDLENLGDEISHRNENETGTTKSQTGGRGRKKEDEEAKELKSIQTSHFFDDPIPLNTTNTNPDSKTGLEANQSEFLLANNKVQWEPPKQVVKRITRKIASDGTETIEVRFIVSETEVHRVMGTQKSTISNTNQSNPRKKTSSHANEGEEIFEEERAESHSLKINLGKIKTKVTFNITIILYSNQLLHLYSDYSFFFFL